MYRNVNQRSTKNETNLKIFKKKMRITKYVIVYGVENLDNTFLQLANFH